ncbi:Alpha/beta hydrolase family protein [Rubripirellula tenax]|uniref:Alpha/beta hydrolase family protein n=1 Tax=Rubripirellula tenax TaxID=2528015 RepID=A0A5C6FL94_9BACT|nr:lipase [Rubripirellula tenax]TWU60839.1 Alpha/beta hydrolase family protein [Rubripirellula tenax]
MKRETNQAVVFGEYEHLLGVWRVAAEPTLSSVAAIMVTPGMLHHVGPNRLHVDLAESLSSLGIASLRFDLSGIGESLGVGVGGRSIDRAADEIRQAINWIEEHAGITQFVLFGLCSGADDSIHAALRDQRVVGVVAMDGCGYPTLLYHWYRFTRHFLPRVLRLDKWRTLWKRRRTDDGSVVTSLQPGKDVREFPTQTQAIEELKTLSSRGALMHFVYTGGVGDYFNHAGQFAAMFPTLKDDPRISSHFFESMDHVALMVEDRRQLVTHVANRMRWMAVSQANGNPARSTDQDATVVP